MCVCLPVQKRLSFLPLRVTLCVFLIISSRKGKILLRRAESWATKLVNTTSCYINSNRCMYLVRLALFSVSNCTESLKMTNKAVNENHFKNKILCSVLSVASELDQAAVSLLLLQSIFHNPP